MTKEQELIHNLFIKKLDAMVKKDVKALNEVLDDEIITTHMSGKQQSKDEFIGEIRDGILNYFGYEIEKEEITVNGNTGELFSIVTLDAKVYGIPGARTLSMKIGVKKEKDWIFCGKIITHPA